VAVLQKRRRFTAVTPNRESLAQKLAELLGERQRLEKSSGDEARVAPAKTDGSAAADYLLIMHRALRRTSIRIIDIEFLGNHRAATVLN
jgi:hypothetical protein